MAFYKKQKKPTAPPWEVGPTKEDEEDTDNDQDRPKPPLTPPPTASFAPPGTPAASTASTPTTSFSPSVKSVREKEAKKENKPRFSKPVVITIPVFGVLLLLLLLAQGGTTSSAPTKEEPGAYTKWFVQQAINYYDNAPNTAEISKRQNTIDYYKSAESRNDEDQWYIFIIDAATGVLEAQAVSTHLIGTTVNEKTDIDDSAYGEELLSAPATGKWVEYIDYNPQTKKGGLKHTWVVNHNGLIFGSGWYEASYKAFLLPTKKEPGAYTRMLVEEALWRYEAEGREAFIEYYSSAESIDGEWYVFVLDSDGTVLADVRNPDNVGENILGEIGIDNDGFNFGAEMLKATEGGLWVDYESDLDNKNAWIMKHEDIFIGSAWTQTKVET